MRRTLVGLSVVTLSASSCGGMGGELPPSAPHAAVSAVAPALAPTAVAAPVVVRVAAPKPPAVPGDAWVESVDDQDGIEQGFAARYPMHGVAFHVMSEIFERPAADAEVLGYMRRGTRFRAAAGERGPGCERTWHELSSGGFVCSKRGFMLGHEPQTFQPSAASPARYDALPYRYAKNQGNDVPQFWRVPSQEEATAARELITLAREAMPSPTAAGTGVPAAAAVGAPLAASVSPRQPSEFAESADPDAPGRWASMPDYVRMGMQPGFYVSLDAEGSARMPGDGEEPASPALDWERTVRGAFVEARQLTPVSAPTAAGVPLAGAGDLPLALAYRGDARRLRRDTDSGQMRTVEPLARFEHAHLTGQHLVHDGRPYVLASDGHFISERNLRVARTTQRPPQVPRGARWIHVNLAEQTLVAYEGDRPVFTTLVSSGKEGHDTPDGLYRIHTKHVSTTMDGLAGTDDVYSIEDVPWTMYFHGSYALHAAFWHDRFGQVRSHGCVNLAPSDARWLFSWTTPEVPRDWHGTRALRQNPGTYVFIDRGGS